MSMSPRDRYAGLYVAPLLPMHRDLAPDTGRWIAHCRFLLAQGCHGLMPLGSTGEAHSLTVAERLKLMDALAGSGLPMDRMIVGASALAYPDAVALIRHATGLGARAVATQPAFYYKGGEQGLYDYFKLLVDKVADDRLRLIVYDWEANLGVKFPTALLERLFGDFPRHIVGIKDSNGDHRQIAERCRRFPDRAVIAGTDASQLACLRAGGRGAMSASGNILYATMLELHRDFAGEKGEACQKAIDEFGGLLRPLGFFAALKATMAQLANDPAWRTARPPVAPLSAADQATLEAGLARLGIGRKLAAE
ncbi:MAG: dihydrodipicolinate synthase family protein [Reyranellaceae bacterium]